MCMCVCVCVFAEMLFYMKVVHVWVSIRVCEFLCVSMWMNACVAERPYDK